MASDRKVALVTGASYGIGAETAVALAESGFDVAVTDISPDDLASTVAKSEAFGAKTAALALDFREEGAIARAFAEALAEFGQIDVLVNNAGIPAGRKPAIDVTMDEWELALRINLTGTYFMSTEMGRYLIGAGRSGSVVSISSTHGVVGYPEASAYGVTKAGINQMTRVLAIEWAKHGIRVNAIAPGPTETKTRAAAHSDPSQREFTLGRVPMGRYGSASEVAKAACYLAGDDSTFVTGHVLVIDGGVTAQ